jgi:hypothetical protein
VHIAEGRIRRAQFANDRKGERTARYGFADQLRKLADVRSDMRDEGMTPPKLPPDWVAELKRLGEEG